MFRRTVPTSIKPMNSQRGVMLLEALIALLIFAFGVLALVGLQATSIKNVSESQYRVEAANWADTLIARMRVGDPDPAGRIADFSSSPAGPDYTAWKDQIIAAGAGLPREATTPLPEVNITTTGPVSTVNITISWRAPTDTVTRKYQTTTMVE